jgi:hypothetical protein
MQHLIVMLIAIQMLICSTMINSNKANVKFAFFIANFSSIKIIYSI